MQNFRTHFILILVLLWSSCTSYASELNFMGTHRLDQMGKNLPRPTKSRASRKARTNRQIGDTQKFNTFNFATNKWEETTAKLCMAGENLYIYLEDGKEFDTEIFGKLVTEFDSNIYPTTTRYFGHEAKPGIDNDDHITILLMDIRDDFETSGTYTSGYFNRGDCYLPSEIPEGVDLKTNCREMLYVDINPSDVSSKEFFATIAHEFQHLIHFNHDPEEFNWLNEGCSQITTNLCGYGHPRQIQAFLKNPDNSLIAWSPWHQVANYGQTYLWCYFVMNKFCQNEDERVKFFRQLVDDQEKGMQSFDKQFKVSGSTFLNVFNDFCITNFVNRNHLSPSSLTYGSEFSDFQLPATAFIDRLPTFYRNNVSIWGADMVKVAIKEKVAQLKVDFAGDLTSLPNSFSVALVFLNEKLAKVNQIKYIENIKPTTRNSMEVSRVMLPGDNDGYPPPPPVKTQMGDIVAEVPADTDMLYVVIMGKGPADIPDSSLVWEGKATYRLDVAVTKEAKDISPNICSTSNLENLLANYLTLKNGLAESDKPEETLERLEATCGELQNILQGEADCKDQERPATRRIQDSSELVELADFANKLQKFSELHK